MLEDKFKLSKMNIMLIIVNVFLVILVILASIQLIRSINDNEETVPHLRTTADKSSTLEADLTRTTETEETTSETTKKVGNTSSPYYDLDVNELFNNEILTKADLSQPEREELIKFFFTRLGNLLDVTNNDVIDIAYLMEHSKPDEDKIELNGHKYGLIYNGKDYLNKLFRNITGSSVLRSETKGVMVIAESNGNYYKLENILGDSNIKIDSYAVKSSTGNRIEGKMTYYHSNYKELGLQAPDYSSKTVELIFDTASKSWKVDKFTYPNIGD